MEVAMETGTLKELNVKPGDVVEWLDLQKDNIFTVVSAAVITDGLYQGEVRARLEGYGGGIFDKEQFRIISRAAQPTSTPDLTAITTPFGLLDAATQEALRAHGGPYEWWNGEVWNYAEKACAFSSASPAFAYRVKPEPKRETVTDDRWLIPHNGNISFDEMTDRTPVRVTFDRVDGKIDLSTYKVEPR